MPIFTSDGYVFISAQKQDLSRVKLTILIHILLLIYLSACVVLYRNDLIIYATIRLFLPVWASWHLSPGRVFIHQCARVTEFASNGSGRIGAAFDTIATVFNKVSVPHEHQQPYPEIFLGTWYRYRL